MAIIRRSPLSELAHWEPFREVERLQSEMNRLFEQFMPTGNGHLTSVDFMPSAEIDESPSEFHLKLEVPGMEADDIEVEVTDNRVTVKGERKSESKTEEEGLIRSEFHYGKFERSMALPGKVEAEGVKAEYKNGVLNLTVPKVAEAEKKSVKVSVS